jgi:HAD superfamily hydrolase (TIGR01450 family)
VIDGSATPLARRYDVALLDLDGVVYVGQNAVPAAPAALRQARELGMRLAFVTNNAARTATAVATHLTELGIAADVDEVITSSQTAAHYLAERHPAGSAILVIGTTGLTEAVRERGLVPVFSADDDPVAVVQGYSPDTDWRMLAEAAIAVRRGLPWVATNLDATLPSDRGPLPGNGSLIAAVRHATGATPVAVGKPEPTMHRESVERSHAERPVVVGDRLDTDIQGARTVGCASLLVFSGVCTPAEVVAAPRGQRPDFVAADLSGLLSAHPAVVLDSGTATCGGWRARIGSQHIELSGSAFESDDGYDALRAICVAAWSDGVGASVRAADDPAATAVSRLGL